MQNSLDSLMKKWMDACETKDDKCKEQFKHGMEKLVQSSAEENGVWQILILKSSVIPKCASFALNVLNMLLSCFGR